MKKAAPWRGRRGISSRIDRTPPHNRPPPQLQAEAEFRRNVGYVVQCGDRVVGEVLTEIGERFMCRSEIEIMLRRYRRRLAALAHGAEAPLGEGWWQ